MRIKGKIIQGPMVETVVIPRPEEDLVFKCQAVLDFAIFEKLVPEPVPPLKTPRGKPSFPDFEDKEYQKALTERNFKKFQFLVLESLKATEGLEFETINGSDPSTWGNLENELKSSGLAPAEIGLIFQGVTAANGMSEDKLKEARARFFDMEKEKAVV